MMKNLIIILLTTYCFGISAQSNRHSSGLFEAYVKYQSNSEAGYAYLDFNATTKKINSENSRFTPKSTIKGFVIGAISGFALGYIASQDNESSSVVIASHWGLALGGSFAFIGLLIDLDRFINNK